MRHVPIAQFKDRMSEMMAAAEAGEDIIITRHGRDYMKLVPVAADRLARQRQAVDALYSLGQRLKVRSGATGADDIRGWIDEGRR